MTILRTSARALAIPAAAGVVLLSAASVAHAHVGVSATTTAAGAYTVLTVSVPHGCDGSPTTRVAIQIPESITQVTPTRNPLYQVAVTKKKLAQPVTDSHGNRVTERDAVVVYTARTPLPDGQRDAFELSLKLPDQPGATLVFPAVQTCEKGESAWTEVAADGQDPHDLELPAPTLTLTAAESDGHGHAASATPEPSPAGPGIGAAADSGGNLLGGLGLAAGLAGLTLGGIALFQVRRRG